MKQNSSSQKREMSQHAGACSARGDCCPAPRKPTARLMQARIAQATHFKLLSGVRGCCCRGQLLHCAFMAAPRGG